MAKRGKYRNAKLRSGFEDKVRDFLKRALVPFEYEPYLLEYYLPVKVCHVEMDGAVVEWIDPSEYAFMQRHTYRPDFVLGNRLHVEAKGKFTAKDRKKMVAVKALHPEIEFALLFQRDNTLTSASKTRYSVWAEKHGFKWAVSAAGELPSEWIG